MSGLGRAVLRGVGRWLGPACSYLVLAALPAAGAEATWNGYSRADLVVTHTAERGVAFRVTGTRGIWVQVAHAEGARGWIHRER